MDLADRFISALKKRQVDVAVDALQTPAGRDSFEYGRVSGKYLGLQDALTTIENIIRAEDDKDAAL